MIFSRGAQAALAIVSTFALTQAKSSNVEVKFDKCVTGCVDSAGCASNDVKCMCTSARDDSLLDIVAQCLYFHCIPELKKFDSSFMDIIVNGCKEFGKAIPQDDIDSAEATAELFVQKLAAGGTPLVESTSAAASTTVKKPSSTSAKALTTMTTSPTKKEDSTTAKPTSTLSSEAAQTTETDDGTSNTTTSSTQEIVAPTTTESTPQSTTLVMATGSPTKSAAAASTTAAQSASTKCDSSDPFGNPCPDSAAVRSGMSWMLAGVPVVVALMMR